MIRGALAAAVAAVSLLTSPSAFAQQLEFSVVPGGASLTEGGVSVVFAQPTASPSTYTLEPDTETVHHYLLQRAPFDDLAVTVQWQTAAHIWERQTPEGLVPVDRQTQFELSRTVQLHSFPAAVKVQAQLASGAVVDLPLRNGAVTIPSAWHPPPLILTRPAFQPLVLNIPAGALDTPDAVYPSHAVWLHPQYGPLSYWQFNLLAGLAIVLGWGYRWWTRRETGPTQESHAPSQQRSEPQPDRPDSERQWTRTEPLVTQGGLRVVVGDLLGRGSTGTVFAVDCPQAGPDGTLAAKILLPSWADDPTGLERLVREVRICAGLRHPGLVRVLDWGLARPPNGESPRPFLVMERLDGATLGSAMKAGPLDCGRALTLISELLEVLAVAHRAGVIHRDLKPDNVMILRDGHVKLMDFGVARVVSGELREGKSLTDSGAILGTPAYMSPENFNARSVRPSSDLYSLGVVLYQMVSGALPYSGVDLWGLASRIVTGAVIPLNTVNGHLPPDLYRIVERMMAPDPDDRYQTADEAQTAVRALLERL